MQAYRTGDDIKEELNDRFDDLYFNDNGTYKPRVCLVCDKFLGPKEWKFLTINKLKSKAVLLKPGHSNEVSENVKDCYRYTGNGRENWMSDCLLSPRGCFLRENKKGFLVCSKCKCSLEKSNTPMYAIANNFAFGEPPDFLTDLTEAELALLTPCRTFGYCYTFVGGRNTKLKGTLGYYKVSNIENQESFSCHWVTAVVSLKEVTF
jgi:hypothetical protein